MARGRKVSTKTLDEKIESGKRYLAKSKRNMKKDKAEMSHLLQTQK